MDWTKAKTILIIAFLATNLFLGANLLFAQPHQEAAAVGDQYIEQTIQFLAEQDVTIETTLPHAIPSLASVTVEYHFFPAAETAELLLGSSRFETVEAGVFENEQGRVTITNEKQLVFQNFVQDDLLPDMNEQTLEETSREFLSAHGLFPEGLSLQQIYVGILPEYDSDPLHKLVYEQTHQNRFIGESYVHVFLNQRGIVAVEALLLNIPEEAGQVGTPRPMISAPEAVLRKLEAILEQNRNRGPIVISRIEPGYYFTLTRDPVTQWETVASGTAVPAWKIVLKNGDTYYQEAF